MTNSNLTKLFGIALFFTFGLLIVDGFIPQFKMALHGGYLPPDSFPIKLVLIGCLFLIYVSTVKIGRSANFGFVDSTKLQLIILSFAGYLTVHLLVSFLILDRSLVVLVYSYVDALFFLFFVFPAVSLLPGVMDWRVATRILILVSIPLCVLGLYQFIFTDTVLPTLSRDLTYRVYGWSYYGRVRAFSLFGSGLKFSFFLALTSAVVFAYAKYLQASLLKVGLYLILGLMIVTCVATLTRNGYMTVAFSLLSVMLFHKWPRTSWTWLPLVYLAFAIFTVFLGWAISDLHGGSSAAISSSDSLSERIRLWGIHLSTWLQTDLGTMFFGTGFTQSRRFFGDDEAVIDNVFIAIGYQLGIFGLILFVFSYCLIWLFLYKKHKENIDNPFLTGSVAFWSTFLSSGVFNTSQNVYLLWVPLIFMVVPVEKKRIMKCA